MATFVNVHPDTLEPIVPFRNENVLWSRVSTEPLAWYVSDLVEYKGSMEFVADILFL